MKILSRWAKTYGWLLLTVILVGFAVPAEAGRPTLLLFPKDVTEKIKEVSQASQQMETSVGPVISSLQTQMELYKESNCEGDVPDKGCTEIRNQIADNYNQMLGIMGGNLPNIGKKIKATNISLGKKISREMGKKVTPSELQKLIGEGSLPKIAPGKARMSRQFQRYYKLITAHGSNNKTMATMAAEMYLDNQATMKWIDLINAEIVQQQMALDQFRQIGILTDEMVGSVAQVKGIIFPEEDNDITPPGGNPVITPSEKPDQWELGTR